jgi:4a-hydroxytetrahydrobiopterin dehydratase
MGDLAKGKCVPCEGSGEKKLEPAQVQAYLPQVPDWKLSKDGQSISRKFKFEDFVPAMKFVNKVADLAEAEGHHPDFHIHWNKVELVLWTHALGGLHLNDFVVAAKIDGIA